MPPLETPGNPVELMSVERPLVKLKTLDGVMAYITSFSIREKTIVTCFTDHS